MESLTIEALMTEAAKFALVESVYNEPSIYGATDGKAIGTYLEHKFKAFLASNYDFVLGNSASGIDIPELGVDIKVTSITQPQSSCPYKSARQKIWGLGYSLVVFVYEKVDDHLNKTAKLNILHTILVQKEKTGDYQTTSGIRKIVENNGNKDDILAFIQERMLPVDDIEASNIADDVFKTPPEIGYLTISNALQWRLQYARVIKEAGKVEGVIRI
ncbi:MAG: restriction endonuclease [Patescibacteria group bacterium]